MKLKTIAIKNFQGMKNQTFDFQGKNSKIFGTNAAGKTTIANAFTWLLFDRSYTDIKGFSPKPQGDAGQGLHNLETVVTAELITDERTIKLSKEFKEKWTNKRGSVQQEFTGHTTSYFIDDVPTSAGDYQKFIDSIIDKDKARILTTPLYFAEIMSWQERRKLLMETFGDVSNDDVFNSDVALLTLKDEIGTLSIDDFIAKNKNILSKAIKEVEESKVRIDELSNIEKPADDINTLEKEKAELFVKLEQEQQKIANIKANKIDTSSIDEEINKTFELLQQSKEKRLAKMQEQQEELAKANRVNQEKLDTQNKALRQLLNRLDEITSIIDKNNKLILEKTAEREAGLKKLDELDDTVFDETSAVCPTCNRQYDAEKIEDMKAKFNNNLADEIERVKSYIRANCSQKIITELEEDTVKLQAELSTINADIDKIKNLIAETEQETVAVAESGNNEWLDNTIKEQENKFEELKVKKQALLNSDDNAKMEEINAISDVISALKSELEQKQVDISKINAYNDTKKRLAELEEQQAKNIEIRENAENNIELSEHFIRAKMDMLSSKINNQFKNIKFKLFDKQINGGIKEICEILVPDEQGNNIAFSVANNAGRINACIEIINFLSEVWGVRLPLFIDNAESIVKLADTETQIIQLIVSEEDKQLRLA